VYDGPTGSIAGVVYVVGPAATAAVNVDARACPAAAKTYGMLFRAGPTSGPGRSRPLADAAVSVVAEGRARVPAAAPVARTVIGANCAYPMRTLSMTFGQTLEIRDEAAIPFAPALDLAPTSEVAPATPHGAPVRLVPQRTGYFTLFDRAQLFVRQDLYVFSDALHTVSAVDGSFRIDGVPVGQRAVVAELAAIGTSKTELVDVLAGHVTRVALTLTFTPVARGWFANDREGND
jgi:hypothetical protein